MSDINVQDLGSFRVPPDFRGRSKFYVQLWWLVQALLIRPSPQALYGWRNFWLRAFGATVGSGVRIRPSVRITYPWKVEVGRNSWIGDRAELYSLSEIEIGENVCISQDAYLCTGSHDMTRTHFPYLCDKICVRNEAWIATGAFIAPGVTIGKGAVVGARSVLLESIGDMTVYAGHPAKMVRANRLEKAKK